MRGQKIGPGLRVLLVTPDERGSLGFFCQRAFAKMGHITQVFNYRAHVFGADYLRSRSPMPRWLRILQIKPRALLMNQRLCRMVSRFAPDLVLVIKGELIEPRTVRALTARGRSPIVLWYPDASHRLVKRFYQRIARGMAFYDATFVVDPTNLPAEIRPSIRRLEYLTFACDPDFHHRVQLTSLERVRYESHICFVGNSHGPGSPRNTALLALADYPLAVWGLGWERTLLAEISPQALRGPAYADQMLKVYSGSEIALNFSLDRYLVFRNFEVPACGPLLVTEQVPELEGLFHPGEEIVVYNNLDELRHTLDHYLAHPKEAAAIARRGEKRARTEHTFVRRMQELLGKVLQ
jgi:spore maturation protein CgeB